MFRGYFLFIFPLIIFCLDYVTDIGKFKSTSDSTTAALNSPKSASNLSNQTFNSPNPPQILPKYLDLRNAKVHVSEPLNTMASAMPDDDCDCWHLAIRADDVRGPVSEGGTYILRSGTAGGAPSLRFHDRYFMYFVGFSVFSVECYAPLGSKLRSRLQLRRKRRMRRLNPLM
jgi:hypothetical protein